MKPQELIDSLVQEARRQEPPPADLSSVEAKLMERIAQGDPPRFPAATPPRRRTLPLVLVGIAAAAAAVSLLWRPSPSPPPPFLAVSTPSASSLASSSIRKFHTDREGFLIEIPRLASLWIEAQSQGSTENSDEQLHVILEEGAVSLDVQPQQTPDRVDVLAGPFRVSVKGTKFRVAYLHGQLDVDVDHGVVQVTSVDKVAAPQLLQKGEGGSFSTAAPAQLRPWVSFVHGPQPSTPSGSSSAEPVASAAASTTVASTVRAAGDVGAPPAKQYSLQELQRHARELISLCAKNSSNIAPGVVVTIETTLSLSLSLRGQVESFSFSPPLAPTIQQCFEGGKNTLYGPSGAHQLPLTLQLGGR